MIYKKSKFKKLFRLNDHCQSWDCKRIFREGDVWEWYDSGLWDIKLCMPCIAKAVKKDQQIVADIKQRKLNQKRADAKILAEEIVKLLKE